MRILAFIVMGLGSLAVFAQNSILDDSTELVYGPETVEFYFRRNFKNNLNLDPQNPDTLVHRMEKYHIEDQTDRSVQTLGWLGSPTFDLTYSPSLNPGRTMGYEAYNAFFKNPEDFRYYDTKSPFMDVGVVLGGDARTVIDYAFTRNINENWNLGIDINRITADKQIGSTTLGDRATESSAFDVYFWYNNEDFPYMVMASVASMNHNVADIGGVAVPINPSPADFYQYENSSVLLREAQTLDSRTQYHVYHQYTLGSGLQLYHEFDHISRLYDFVDFRDADAGFDEYYLEQYIERDSVFEEGEDPKALPIKVKVETTYSALENEVGFKGDFGGAFYRFYARRRQLIYNPRRELVRSANENYIGTYLRFDWGSRFSVFGNGELSDEGAYALTGTISNRFLRVNYQTVRRLPSFLISSYGSFDPFFTNQLSGSLRIQLGVFEILPHASAVTYTNGIFFNEEQIPIQTQSTILINSIGTSVNFDFFRTSEFEHFRWESDVTLMQVSGNEKQYVRTPAVRLNSRLFWRGLWFQNAVPVEAGVDLYFRSGFRANQYDPVTGNFYQQNDLMLSGYPSLDLFINMQIRSLRAFVKYVHVNQENNGGYMVTPYYPGQKAIIDVGVQWLFFD